jgi:putative addiction module killer protein
MIEVQRTPEFLAWLKKLRDLQAKVSIQRRLLRMEAGNFGDVRPVGGGISELRVDVGPGYRLYFTKVHDVVVLLLCAGDKSSQKRDIERAKHLASNFGGRHEP